MQQLPTATFAGEYRHSKPISLYTLNGTKYINVDDIYACIIGVPPFDLDTTAIAAVCSRTREIKRLISIDAAYKSLENNYNFPRLQYLLDHYRTNIPMYIGSVDSVDVYMEQGSKFVRYDYDQLRGNDTSGPVCYSVVDANGAYKHEVCLCSSNLEKLYNSTHELVQTHTNRPVFTYVGGISFNKHHMRVYTVDGDPKLVYLTNASNVFASLGIDVLATSIQIAPWHPVRVDLAADVYVKLATHKGIKLARQLANQIRALVPKALSSYVDTDDTTRINNDAPPLYKAALLVDGHLINAPVNTPTDADELRKLVDGWIERNKDVPQDQLQSKFLKDCHDAHVLLSNTKIGFGIKLY